MSWLQDLYQTYEQCSNNPALMSESNSLLPICHITQNAHITVILNASGQFQAANVLEKGNLATIVPCTEGSAGRSGSKPVNHPLCDKLQYVAGDYVAYGGEVTIGYQKHPTAPYENYLQQLAQWVTSPHTHPKVRAVYQYVKQGRLIADLLQEQRLFVGDDGKLLKQWQLSDWLGTQALLTALGKHRHAELASKLEKENNPQKRERLFSDYAPDLYKIMPAGQTIEAALVRWEVQTPDNALSATWEDPSLFQAWIEFYSQREAKPALCMVTGESTTIASQHPSGIRHGADKAKLISSNDTTGFTFRGRFTDDGEQACTVAAEVTQKAHNALRWLIQRRQAYRFGDQVYVTWAISGDKTPNVLANSYDVFADDDDADNMDAQAFTAGVGDVGQYFAQRFSAYLSGAKRDVSDTQNIVIMGLDSATPGRMAITYYRILQYAELLQRLQRWHGQFAWHQTYGKDICFYGAPSPRDIAEAAYGRNADDKIKKLVVERLLPCIVEQADFPADLLNNCVRRASEPQKMEDRWEREKVLGIACALYRGCNQQENYVMGLEEDRNNRDYLYGRLLAVADYVEEYVQWDKTRGHGAPKDQQTEKNFGPKRQTNAVRYMQRFSRHPCQTWVMLHSLLDPYLLRIKKDNYGLWHKIMVLISKINDQFESPEAFSAPNSLSGEYLLAYYCQRSALLKGKAEIKADNETDTATEQPNK